MRAPGLASLIVFSLVACRDEATQPMETPTDEVPPAAVIDLAIDGTAETSIRLRWSAPGNDGAQGVAWRYDIRYATEPITADNWGEASQVGGEPPPGFPGWVQIFEIIHLVRGRTYYFGLETYDHDHNRSALSNIVPGSPGSRFDETAPAAIEDLRMLESGSNSVTLTWTAPGDDDDVGQVQGYLMRYASFPLDESNFGSGTYLRWTPIPHPVGQAEELVVEGLAAQATYYFAVRSVDDAGNVSPLSNLAIVTTHGDGLGKGVMW